MKMIIGMGSAFRALVVLVFCALPLQVMAQEEPSEQIDEQVEQQAVQPEPTFGIMGAAEVSRFFPDKTLWTQGSPYRLYFDRNGRFEHQTDGSMDGMPAAGRYQGTWRVDNSGNLCLNYYEPNEANNSCYFVLKGGDEMRPWGRFDDPIILAPFPKKGQGEAGMALPLNRWAQGNLIFNDAYFGEFATRLEAMNTLRMSIAENGIPENIRQKTADPSLSGYINDMIGAVMIFPLGGGTFHAADGRAMTLSADEVNAIKANPTIDALPARTFDSVWFVDGHIQCWITVSDPRDTLCQEIHAGSNSTLAYRPVDGGVVTHTQDGYTRILSSESFIPLKK